MVHRKSALFCGGAFFEGELSAVRRELEGEPLRSTWTFSAGLPGPCVVAMPGKRFSRRQGSGVLNPHLSVAARAVARMRTDLISDLSRAQVRPVLKNELVAESMLTHRPALTRYGRDRRCGVNAVPACCECSS